MIGAVLLLLGLLIVGALVVQRLTRRGGSSREATPEGHATRQLFQYVLLFGLVVVTAIGLAGLLAALFARDSTLAVSESALARSVAFTLVGAPLLAGLAIWSRQTLARDPGEAHSGAWALYVTVASLVSLVVAVFAVHDVLSWALGLRPFVPQAAADALVWTTTWAVHWWLGKRTVDSGLMRTHLLGGSLLGLAATLVGLGVLLSGALEIWLGLDAGRLIAGRHSPVAEGAVTLGLGAAVWGLYWWRNALGAERDGQWHAYVLLAGSAAGLVVFLVAGSIAAFRVLVWLVGEPGTSDAERYFDTMPAALAATCVGLLTLAYHQGLLSEAELPGRSEVDRVRDYVLAGIGLVAAAAGTTILVVALVEALVEPSLVTTGGPGNTVLAALTLLGVGAPSWWGFWRRGQQAVADEPEHEVSSPTRRIYLVGLLGVAGLAAVAALLAGAWLLIEGLMLGTAADVIVRDIRFAIGILVTAGAVATYHWVVYGEEREAAGAEGARDRVRPGPRFVLLLGVGDAGTAEALARRTGAGVWAWTRTDVAPRRWPEEALLVALETSGAPEVLVLADDERLRVVPIDRRLPVRLPPVERGPVERGPVGSAPVESAPVEQARVEPAASGLSE
ncbi:DUF5671 domain-containing protein [Nocardioides pacificus]